MVFQSQKTACVWKTPFRKFGHNYLSFNDDIFNLTLNDLQERVLSMGCRVLFKYGLPCLQTVDIDRFARVRIS